jgi:2'-5' RNA ligase
MSLGGLMALAVEAYFDPRAEEAIQALRKEIHAAGIEPTDALAGSRPHLSLAVVETDDERLLGGVIETFARKARHQWVRLAAVSTFASPQGVLFLAPVPTTGLLELHDALHTELLLSGLESRSQYRPGAWIPHCTLELDLSGSRLAVAFEACWRAFTPVEGRLSELAVVAYPPPRRLVTVPLGEP